MRTTMEIPKPLHELLSNAQEPFLLHDYIRDRRSQLNRPLVPALSKTKLQGFRLPVHYDFCLKRISFLRSHNPTKSPQFEFPLAREPPTSPCLKNAVSLRVPAKTAALLLEAQKTSSARLPRKWSFGSGFVGMILKRFVPRKSETAHFVQNGDDDEPLRDKTASGAGDHVLDNDVEGNGAVCDESSRGSSLPFETPNCSSPKSQSREFSSPRASLKHFGEGNEEEENCRPKGKNVDEEREELQQFSPVSVLDPPSEVDDEDVDRQVVDHEEDDENVEHVGFNYDCSYAFVQRTKEQLLDKLQRFERLARLDPVELEKRMQDSDEERSVSIDDTTAMEHEDRDTKCCHGPRKSPRGISKLVADLVAKEEGELELRAPRKPFPEQLRMLAEEIEVGIFQSLLEELTVEETPIC